MAGREDVDYVRLEENMRALGFASRLELLNMLRFPLTLQEIKLPARQIREGTNPDRTLTRQAIRLHLEKLVEVGVVTARDSTRPGKRGKEYVVDPRRLYHIAEEFRRLTTYTVGAQAPPDATMGWEGAHRPEADVGPRVVLVHGLMEGSSFPLRASDREGARGWVIGRRADVHVALPYDPYVSLENSEIIPTDGGHELLDLRSSKNGTTLNWRPLDPDERVPLETGDVIGVGRSLLVFRGS